MQTQTLEIINKLGLHARAASKLVQEASRFGSKITIAKDGKTVDGKSIMSVMLLAASQGTMIDVSTEGPDEEEAMRAIADLINDYFGEGE